MQNQLNQPSQENTKKHLTWQALEFPDYQKHPLWFLGIAVLMGAVVVYAIYTGSWSMTAVFILIAILTIYLGAQKPKTITIRIDAMGVTINKLTYSYKIIKKFWIVYSPPQVKVLYLETGAYLNNLIRIELGQQDPVELKKFLGQYLEEDLDAKESMVDIISRKLKF